jgi:hypothetical protein
MRETDYNDKLDKLMNIKTNNSQNNYGHNPLKKPRFFVVPNLEVLK